MLHIILGILIFVLTLAVIMVRPYRISEALAATVGSVLMLMGGFLLPGEAIKLLLSEWNIYGFFLGLMAITAIADQAGIFEVLANRTARLAKGSSRRLFVGVFLAGVLLTSFLSNDATALLLTPAVFALVTRLRLPALPFMFACTFIADTASFMLPVSNPINILILDRYGAGLGAFLSYLFLPAVFCIVLNIAVFLFLFRADLHSKYDLSELPQGEPPDLAYFQFTIITLGIIAITFVLASSFQAPLSLVALGGAAVLLIGTRRFGHLKWSRLRSEISWPLFVFISGMFLVIRGVENLGLTGLFGSELIKLAGASPLRASLITAAGSALGANLINNVPMALVMISALQGMITTGQAHNGLVYAAILGCDLGPNLTTVGSLATMLWLLILRRKGLEISSIEYFKLGILVVPIMIIVGGLLIWLHG
jgi:arsenical pump membrane protein